MTEVPNRYLDFNVTGAERKRLVMALSEYVGEDPVYLGAPSFAYQVDGFTIDSKGCVSFDSSKDGEEIEGLLRVLAPQGFVSLVSNLGLTEDEVGSEDAGEAHCEDSAEPISDEPDESVPSEASAGVCNDTPPAVLDESGNVPEPKDVGPIFSESPEVILEIPADCVSMDNLTKLLEAKGRLFKKALGVDDLPVEVRKDTVAFPWFPDHPDTDTAQTRIRFITALCQMSKRQKRVVAKEKDVESEKFAMRTFLLRLGFIGAEYKKDRKTLLKNLSGNSSSPR